MKMLHLPQNLQEGVAEALEGEELLEVHESKPPMKKWNWKIKLPNQPEGVAVAQEGEELQPLLQREGVVEAPEEAGLTNLLTRLKRHPLSLQAHRKGAGRQALKMLLQGRAKFLPLVGGASAALQEVKPTFMAVIQTVIEEKISH